MQQQSPPSNRIEWLAIGSMALIFFAVITWMNFRQYETVFHLQAPDVVMISAKRCGIHHKRPFPLQHGIAYHNVLAFHFTPIFALMAPVLWIWEDPRILCISVQTALHGRQRCHASGGIAAPYHALGMVNGAHGRLLPQPLAFTKSPSTNYATSPPPPPSLSSRFMGCYQPQNHGPYCIGLLLCPTVQRRCRHPCLYLWHLRHLHLAQLETRLILQPVLGIFNFFVSHLLLSPPPCTPSQTILWLLPRRISPTQILSAPSVEDGSPLNRT